MASPQPSEFRRIDRFVAAFPPARVPVGVGDDAAVLRVGAGRELCVTTDAVVEDVHFTRAHFSPEDIGHKALAVNLSDLAAMGAAPAWFLCALELPSWVDDAVLDGVAAGMSALAKRHRIALVGGNLSRGEKLSLTLTAAGEVPRGKALRRSGARPGDLLYVSGTLGDARLGLKSLRKFWSRTFKPPSVLRQLRPEPRVALGLLARRFARAAMDVSDGLAQDLAHLCRASKVGARVGVPALPVSDELRKTVGEEALMWALSGGEDYELLLAVPKVRAVAFEKACRRAKAQVTRVGEVTREQRLLFVDAYGQVVTPPSGFDHFEPSEQAN